MRPGSHPETGSANSPIQDSSSEGSVCSGASAPAEVQRVQNHAAAAATAATTIRRDDSPPSSVFTGRSEEVLPSDELSGIRLFLQLFKRVPDIDHRLVSPDRVFAQTPCDDLLEVARHIFADLTRRSWLIAQDGTDGRDPCTSLEGPLAGHHLVQHAPEAEDVAASVDGFPFRLFRAHVARRPHDCPILRERRLFERAGDIVLAWPLRLEQLREPKVQELDGSRFGDRGCSTGFRSRCTMPE